MANKFTIKRSTVFRYLAVAALFAFALFYGRDINKEKCDDPNLLIKKQGVVDIGSYDSEKIKENVISTEKGDAIRIFFDAEIKYLSQNPITSDFDKYSLNVYASSVFGEKQKIGEIKFNKSPFSFKNEAFFISEFPSSGLVFEKQNTDEEFSVAITNITSHSINGAHANGLFGTIKSSVDQEATFENIGMPVGKYEFSNKNEKIGQIIRVSSTQISTIDIGMEFAGSGGDGNYTLELHRAYKKEDGNYTIDPENLTHYILDKRKAQVEAQYSKNLYRLPVSVSDLEAGEYYFIGIGNYGVKYNFANTLRLLTDSSNDNIDGSSIRIADDDVKLLSGGLQLRVNTYQASGCEGRAILGGEIIQDLGNGNGYYTYKSNNRFTDYFDVVATSDKTMFFDNGNVAAPALSTEEINYVLDTVFPYNRISLQVDTLDSVYTNAVIWTSIDNRNWQMVERSDGARNKFFQVISGSNGNTKLFIKISYDRADSRENRIKIFGIKKIEVNGELSTNERAR